MNKNKDTYPIDQLIIRVWKACNFKCNFCNVSDNERNVKMKERIIDIVRNFHYKFKYSNLNKKKILITISWWEPSLFKKEVIFILKYAKEFCEKKNIKVYFDMQTNWSCITLDFAKKIKSLWLLESMISFHTIDPIIFKKIIGIEYKKNFDDIISWAFNLLKVWIRVSFNVVLNNLNKNNFFDTIVFLSKKFKNLDWINIWLVQPHWEALKNLNDLLPKYNEIEKIYNKVIFYLDHNNINYISHFVWLPPCYLMKNKYSVEINRNSSFRKNYNFNNKNLIDNLNDNNKLQIKDCKKCLYNNVCNWIWKEYVWLQKLKPVIYKKDFNFNLKNEKNTFWYKLENKYENLKKIYDRNIRQIIISSDLWNKKELYNLLKKSTKIWFYKIILLVSKEFILEEDIFLTWVTNIQINIENIEIWFIDKVLDFSKINKPQFKIDIDIFIKNKNIFIQKKEIIIKYSSSSFINFYYLWKNQKK